MLIANHDDFAIVIMVGDNDANDVVVVNYADVPEDDNYDLDDDYDNHDNDDDDDER